MLGRNLSRVFVVLLTASVSALTALPVAAQFLVPAIDRPGFERRLTQPSLRLATLGGMSLLFDDENNEINLWDFAGSSLGLLDDRDSTSFDVFLDSGKSSDHHDVNGFSQDIDRKRGLNVGLQAVGRSRDKFAIGVDAGYLNASSAVPVQDGAYMDRGTTTPVAFPVLNGRMFGGKFGYGIRAAFSTSKQDFDRKAPSVDGSDVKFQDGQLLGPATPFDVTDGKVSISGFGLGLGWKPAKGYDVALNWDGMSQDLHGSNNTPRRVYELDEPQSSDEFSLSAIANPSWWTLGAQVGQLKFGSTQEYRFTQSGGVAGPPLESRGERLGRNFEQQWLRSRAEVRPRSLENLTVGADFVVRYDKNHVTPSTTPGNFNDFMVDLSTDTLALAPLVGESLDESRHWNAGLGVAYHVTTALQVGVEGHRYNTALDGPQLHTRQKITDFKAAGEYVINPTWTGRLGWSTRSDDGDVYTAQNETVTNLLTLGAGFTSKGRSYGMDAGVEIGDRSTNYPDPSDTSGSIFRFVLYNRWAF